MRSVFRLMSVSGFGLVACALSPAAKASFVIPAVTTTYIYDFANSNTTTQTTGASSKYLTGTSATGTLGVTASAWNITKGATNYTVAQSLLGQYVGGLGVTATDPYDNLNFGNCATGECGTHQLDNQGEGAGSISTDVIQLVFSQAVTLGSVTRNAYGVVTGLNGGNRVYSYDDDMSWGMGTGLSTTSAMTQSTFNSMWSGFDNGACVVSSGGAAGGAYGCHDTDTTNAASKASDAAYASKVWYISAGAALESFSGKDTIADAFKVTGITVYTYTPASTVVPEPASWTMMVLGFGVIGSSIRRRRAAERTIAATA